MRALVLRIFFVLVPFVLTGMAADPGGEIWLEAPDLGVRIQGNTSAVVADAKLRYFTIHLGRDRSRADFGSIKSKINTMSAGGLSDCKSVTSEIICNFDLQRVAGFALRRGRNAIEIEFKDPYERYHYASFLLEVGTTPAPSVSAAALSAPAERTTGQRYAVVVGVSRYQFAGPGLPNLQYADRDASDFRDFLTSADGGNFPRDNIKFLLNEDATSQNVLSALRTFLTKPRPQDVVIVYFAGHGSPDPNDPRNLYLLTYDTKPDDMGGTAIPMTELPKIVSEVVKARRTILIADTCHSSGITGRRGSAGSNNLVNEYMRAISSTGQRAVITASDVGEKSQEDSRWGGGHGVFTYFLLSGLKGEADINHDGTVTTGELFQFVQREVRKATGNQQTPLVAFGLAENLALSGLGVQGDKQAGLRNRGPAN